MCVCVCSMFVCVMVLVGILWIPVIQGMQGAQLFFYIQAVSAYLAPPIASVYLLAVLWRRASEQVYQLLPETDVPRAGCGAVRIDPLRFLAGCLKSRLNQALSMIVFVQFSSCCCL